MKPSHAVLIEAALNDNLADVVTRFCDWLRCHLRLHLLDV